VRGVGGGGCGVSLYQPMSTAVQINFGDLTPYLTYGVDIMDLLADKDMMLEPKSRKGLRR
jgi:hypothetical protein